MWSPAYLLLIFLLAVGNLLTEQQLRCQREQQPPQQQQ